MWLGIGITGVQMDLLSYKLIRVTSYLLAELRTPQRIITEETCKLSNV